MTLTEAEFVADAQGKLLLRGKELSDSDLKQICEGLPLELRELDLSSNSIGDKGVEHLVVALKQRKGLCINLSDNNISDEGVLHLAKLIASGNVKHLNLSCNDITANGIAHLSFTDSPLEVLNLRGNEIGDDGAMHIAKCLDCAPKSLRELDIGNNGIETDGGTAVLMAAGKCSLQSLCLDDCQPSPSNLSDRIVALSKSGLRHLSLRCIGFTDNDASSLATAFAINPPCQPMLVDLQDNASCGTKGRTALGGLARMKTQLKIRL